MLVVDQRLPAKIICPRAYEFTSEEKGYFGSATIQAMLRYDAVILLDISRPPVQPEVRGLASRFAGLKKERQIDAFARANGLLGVSVPPGQDMGNWRYDRDTLFEPLDLWQYFIDAVRRQMVLYCQLAEGRIAPPDSDRQAMMLATYLKRGLQDGIRLDFVATDKPPGLVETRATPYLLAAVLYDLWQIIADSRPVIQCRFCGVPFERFGRRIFCSTACKLAWHRRNKKNQALQVPSMMQ
ncbi:MAG: hypothetical protein H5U02_03700 [Clostridia bacterium]|nr:hypothetical protein [Clostridia bacterium]